MLSYPLRFPTHDRKKIDYISKGITNEIINKKTVARFFPYQHELCFINVGSGLSGITREHSEARIAVPPLLNQGGNAIQAFAGLLHGCSGGDGISQAHLPSTLLDLTSEEPPLPVPAANHAADAGDALTAAHL
uniref:Uncharacterized protein n=1 Tax=Bionectria ochroleuca TaxID=29856 RepID=A0A8H7N964_BIOOC